MMIHFWSNTPQNSIPERYNEVTLPVFAPAEHSNHLHKHKMYLDKQIWTYIFTVWTNDQCGATRVTKV